MIRIRSQRDIEHVRRMALEAQGLLRVNPFGLGQKAVSNCLQHLGYVQIDTIAVVERAHHHVLQTRIPGYQTQWLQESVAKGQLFEYWSHAAAFLPMQDFRFSLPYKKAIKSGQVHWFKNPNRQMMTSLLDRIRTEGPLRSRDIKTSRPNQGKTGWWDWKPAKKALEQLYMEGEVMVVARDGMEKTYDLTERVLPPEVDTRMPSTEALAQHLLSQQLRCHAVVSLKGLTYLRRGAALRLAMKNWVEAQVDQGALQAIRWHDGAIFYIKAGALDQRMPATGQRLTILSPFDNAVIQRERLRTLFDYDYQIECYVPAAKRRFGYFSLPLLYRGAFIGRMDCKAHRSRRELEIKSLHFEPHGFDQDEVTVAMKKALAEFMSFQGCDTYIGLV